MPPDLVCVTIVSRALQPDRVGAYVTGFSSGGAIRFLSDPVRKRDAALLSMMSAWGIEGLVVTSVQLEGIGQAQHWVSSRCTLKSALWWRASNPGGLAKSRRCLAVCLLECGTEVAVARKTEVKCQIGDIFIVFEQV
jgi:hypothetical protein